MMEHSMNFSKDLDKHFTPDIVAQFSEISQSRSSYQLEKFVVNQHDTDEMRYVQIMLEIQTLYYTIKNVSLDMKIKEIKIKELRSTDSEINELEAQKIELGLEQTRVVGVGAFRELDILLNMLKDYKQYTREEIEAAQPEYWTKRMVKQLEVEKTGSGHTHLNSLIQMGLIEYQHPENVIENNKKELK